MSLKGMLKAKQDKADKEADDSIMDLTQSFKGLSVNPNYNAKRDGALGVPPLLSSSDNERSDGYYNAAGYTKYPTKGGIYRKSKKSRKSRKSRKNKKRSKRYRKK
jgi:hypothetical protein